jgi:hypothetical protein
MSAKQMLLAFLIFGASGSNMLAMDEKETLNNLQNQKTEEKKENVLQNQSKISNNDGDFLVPLLLGGLAGYMARDLFPLPPMNTGQQKNPRQNKNNLRQDKVFDEGFETKINGNDIRDFLFSSGCQTNPSPEFKHTKIIHFTKNHEYKEQGSIGTIFKLDKNSGFKKFDKFEKYAKANDAIVCYNITQQPNRDGELKNIDAIIYGTQNLKHCNLYKDYLAAQKSINIIESAMESNIQ